MNSSQTMIHMVGFVIEIFERKSTLFLVELNLRAFVYFLIHKSIFRISGADEGPYSLKLLTSIPRKIQMIKCFWESHELEIKFHSMSLSKLK